MSRFPLLALFILGAILGLACAGGDNPTQPVLPDMNLQITDTGNHVAWGVFDVVLDAEAGSAEIVWNRDAEAHLNVTGSVTPPRCYDCVSIVDTYYSVGALKFYLQIAFRNPTGLTGYDVRGVISHAGGEKFLLNPDGMTTIWGAPMQFRAINVDPERTFGGGEMHGRMYEFYLPPGENFQQLTYIVDASFPTYVDEPLLEEGYSDPVVNNNFATTFVRAKVFDHQGDLNPGGVLADLMSLGGSPQTPMYDDGQHNDLAPGDGVYGTHSFAVPGSVTLGVHMVNVFAMDMGGHMGWGQVGVPVQKSLGGPNEDPIIQDVTWDRTTANGGANEKIKITVTAVDPDGDPLGYLFQASSGSFQGEDENFAYWRPSTQQTGRQEITILVMDDRGGQASQQIYLWSTDLNIISGSTNGMLPSGTLTSIVPPDSLSMPSDFAGQVVYINIWATWCGYCTAEMPDLTAVYNKYKDEDGYNQIFLNNKETESKANDFIQSHNYQCDYWCLDLSGSYFGSLKGFNGGSGGIPQHFLFDRDNHCRYAHVGAYLSGTAELEDNIEQLL